MTRWTREQEAAIYLKNADLLVSAAAGSGKTAVLVERIIQIVIRQKIPILNLLVVTYTNAAAGEMRERIESAISNAIEQTEDASDKNFLIEQLKVLNRASIKTFHAFCMEIIRNHFQKIAIDPGFRMINDTERLILFEEALEQTFEAAYEAQSESFLYLVEAYSGNRDDQKLREVIRTVYRFIQSQPEPLSWLCDQVEAYSDSEHPLRQIWERLWISQIKNKLDGAYETLAEAIEICEMPGGPLPYKETLLSDLTQFEMLESALEQGQLHGFEAALAQFSFVRIKALKKEEKEMLDEQMISVVKDQLRDKVLKKQIFESIATPFKEKSVKRYFSEISLQSNAIEQIQLLIASFEQRFKAMKQEKNVLDFNDLEHYAIEILKDPVIAQSYQSKYDYIFVDEYQDASNIQETILKRIKGVNNLFMVGDVKQSIYKFRLAEPALFIDKYKHYSKYDDLLHEKGIESVFELNTLLMKDSDIHQVRIDLKKNFRTRHEILNRVNMIFKNIMTERLGEIDYDDAAHLVGGATFESPIRPSVQIKLISKKSVLLAGESMNLTFEPTNEGSMNDKSFDGDPDEEQFGLEDLKTEEIEARVIARQIKGLIGKPIFFPKQQVWAPCRYRDIVILIRSFRSWQVTFDRVFSEEGLPFYADSNSGYFDTLEIRLMMDFLKILDNPYQDLSLLAVLRSPMVGFSIDELILIKNTKAQGNYFYDKLLTFTQTPNESELEQPSDPEQPSDLAQPSEIVQRLKTKSIQFIKLYKNLLDFATYLPIDELILKVITQTKFDYYVRVMPGGVSREANLKLLIERARQIKQSRIVNLTLFVQFYEQLSKTSGDMGVASSIGENDDVVRLMSIHKSKGLEFPVVMLAGLGRKFNLMDTQGDLILHKHLGIGLSFVSTLLRTKSLALPQRVMKEQMKLETLSEEMRVLYVGLTRPVDQLFLFATLGDVEKKLDKWSRGCSHFNLYSATCYMDWIMSTISVQAEEVSIIDPTNILDFEQTNLNPGEKAQLLWTNISHQPSAFKTELYNDVARNLNFSFEPIETSLKPQKISVSKLKRQELNLSDNALPTLLETPEFMKEQLPLTPAEKGTLFHRVLEKLDLTKTYTPESLSEFLELLEEKRFLSQMEKKIISTDKIQKFITSDLGIRIKNAKHYKEAPFVIIHENQLVQGIIDLYFEEKDGLILVDYKTDFVDESNLHNVANKYKIQLNTYAKALEEISGKPVVEKIIVFLNHDVFYKI